MPHIIVEYSQNLQQEVSASGVLAQLHRTVVDSGLFSPDAVKARAAGFDAYVLPEGASSFMHITVSILAGRTLPQRAELAQSVFDTARGAIPAVDKLSVDIHEMDAQSYRK